MLEYLIYVPVAALILIPYYIIHVRKQNKSKAILDDNIEAGLTQPASLHPVIDLVKCIGCGACVRECPEAKHDVLGLINNKAHLINPTECIGHGNCKSVCPTKAITLVFGTAERGIDLPIVNSNFETSIPGLYVAGELGGMGLIRSALIQGIEAVENIYKTTESKAGQYRLVIVGGGPAGFGAALKASALGMNYVVIEQEDLGGAVFQYPRRKLVMTSPVDLPLAGKTHFKNTTKEELLEFWNRIKTEYHLNFQYRERVESIKQTPDGFDVDTSNTSYKATSVLLAIGRRGTPRKLGVPGEGLSKVVYRLIDPEQYRGMNVLVVGGGDSALEAAASIAEVGLDTKVILSYRGDTFQRAKQRNRERIVMCQLAGNLTVLLNSKVISIHEKTMAVDNAIYPNDAVIVNIGGVLPDAFLKECGINVVTKWGTE